jgi:hypothetical protein
VAPSTALTYAKGLPPVEPVSAGALPSTNGESDDPHDEKDRCGNPQKMNCESSPKEDQDEQQRENQYHRSHLPQDEPQSSGSTVT